MKSGEADIGIGVARFEFTIQAMTDNKGRPALGPPHFLTFQSILGTGIDVKLPLGFSGTSGWEDLTTPTPMLTGNFNNMAGTITVLPGFSVFKGLSFGINLGFIKAPVKFTQRFTGSSNGIGLSPGAQYVGFWEVGGLDTTTLTPGLAWPNY